MTPEQFDVTILGGGFAGLSTAAALTADTSLSVALVEMRERSKPSIRAVYNDTVQSFGLQAAVVRQYTGMIYRSAYGTTARFEYGSENSLSAVDYTHASQILLQRGLECGLQLRPGRAIRLLADDCMSQKPLRLLLADGTWIETQVLVDASGPAQWTARQMGMPGSHYSSLCYGERLSGCAVEEPEVFAFLAPHQRYGNGGGWFYPMQPGQASYGYSMVVAGRQDARDTARRFQAAKQEFLPYAHWLREAQVDGIEGGAIPLGRVARFCEDRILRVGDAGGQANPWSVEGCRPALETGRLAAQVIQSTFRNNRFDRAALAAFEQVWDRENRERFWRSASVADVVWSRPDAEWERFLRLYQKLPSRQQYWQLRESRANAFEQVYARVGFARRSAVRRIQSWLRAGG